MIKTYIVCNRNWISGIIMVMKSVYNLHFKDKSGFACNYFITLALRF